MELQGSWELGVTSEWEGDKQLLSSRPLSFSYPVVIKRQESYQLVGSHRVMGTERAEVELISPSAPAKSRSFPSCQLSSPSAHLHPESSVQYRASLIPGLGHQGRAYEGVGD